MTKTKKKQGVSLIVLVITIIVMIILAASVVVTLNNTGIINKAGQAVQLTDAKQIEQLASIAWADAYASGKRTDEELKEFVEQALIQNKIDMDKVAVNVTNKGVEVSDAVFEVYPLEVDVERGPVVQVKAKIPVDYENVYVTVERGGATKTITKYETKDGVRVFEYDEGLQYMGRILKIKLHATHKGEEIIKEFEETSIENYVKALLQNTAANLNMSSEKYSALRIMLGDILEFGSMAQLYTGKNTTDLVNEGITEKRTFVELTETDTKIDNSSSGTTYFASAGVHFNAIASLYVKIITTMPDNVKLKITSEGKSVIITSKDFESVGENEYRIYTNRILPIDYDKVFEVELYENDTLCQSLEYSVKSYVYQYQNYMEDDGMTLKPLAHLVRAMYNYGLSVREYLAVK